MPNTKEKGKLIEVLSKHIPYGYATLCLIAEELMSEGITVKDVHDTNVGEWISVEERLPTAEDALLDSSVYAYTKAKKVLVLHYQYVCRRSDYILYWMPIALPQPPKGE